MATLSKEKVQEIIRNAPEGSTPESIVKELVARGHTLEGNPAGDYMHWTGSALNIVTTTIDVTSTNFDTTTADNLTDGTNADALHSHDLFTLFDASNGGGDLFVAIPIIYSVNGSEAGRFGSNMTPSSTPAYISISDSAGATKSLFSATSSSASNPAALYPGLAFDTLFEWRFTWNFSNDSVHSVYYGLDGENADTYPTTGRHIGFRKTLGVLSATHANGTTQVTTDVSSGLDFDDVNYFKIVRGASSILYYINNVLVATHTTNLPSSGNVNFHMRCTDAGTGSVSTKTGTMMYLKVPRTI